MSDGDYEVGYAKPPKQTRFQPGRSGNPSGRRRKPQTLARDLLDEMQDLVTVGEGEARRTLSRQRAILRVLTAKAAAGDPKATAMVLTLVERLIGTGSHELWAQPAPVPKRDALAWLDAPDAGPVVISEARGVTPPTRWEP